MARAADDASTAAPLVLVRAGGQRYALPVGAAREVAPVREATPLPGSAPHVRGLINLRGRIVTVLDLAGRLGLAADEDGAASEQRVVFVEYDAGGERRLGGVEVEAVVGVVPAARASLAAVPETADALGLEPALARALGRTDDNEPFVLLDADVLFRSTLAPASGRSAPPYHTPEG